MYFSAPSSRPSLLPSKMPVTSAPSQHVFSAYPSSFPTHTPSGTFEKYTSNPVRSAFLQNTSAYLNISNSVTFSTLFNKGATLSGTCKNWTDFTLFQLSLPYENAVPTSLIASFQQYNFATRRLTSKAAQCTNTIVIESLLSALIQGIEFSGTCAADTWNAFTCDGRPVLCVNCVPSCKAVVACSGRRNTFNPCQDCRNGLFAAFAAMNVKYELRPLYPIIQTPLQVVVGRKSIQFSISNMSEPGWVYCLAYPHEGTPTSTALFFTAGQRLLVANVSDSGTIQFNNLSPETQYDVYCLTQDLLGHTMPLAAAVSSKTSVTTLCCRSVVLASAYPSIAQFYVGSTRPEPIFKFYLDPPPRTGNTAVTIQILSTSCQQPAPVTSTSVSAAAVALPSKFVFTATVVSAEGSFVVRSAATGCYMLNVLSAGSVSYVNASYFITIVPFKGTRGHLKYIFTECM